MKTDSAPVRPRFYTPNEVASHNTASDIWVSFLGHVYDLTKLVEEHSGSFLNSFIHIYRTSFLLSRWCFDEANSRCCRTWYLTLVRCPYARCKQYNWIIVLRWTLVLIKIRHHIDPVTNCQLHYTPHGRFIHIPPPFPSSDFANDFGIPWWKDENYKIGVLSKKVRTIRILNVLTLQEHLVEVS